LRAIETGDDLAETPWALIRSILAIERKAGEYCKELPDGWDAEYVRELRQREARPLIKSLKDWIDQMVLDPPRPNIFALSKAGTYMNKQWETLVRFLDDGLIRDITNNACERALRRPVLGRKNWLFFGDEEGARLGPILMSLVESCKELAVNPLCYLSDVLIAVQTTQATGVRRLTPKGWKADRARVQSQRTQQSLDEAIAPALNLG